NVHGGGFVASCFPLQRGKASSSSDLCHINTVNMDKWPYLRDEYHAIQRQIRVNHSEKDFEQARRNVMWIRFSYGDSLEWRRVLETDRLMHGTESGTPRLIKNQGGGSKRHVGPWS